MLTCSLNVQVTKGREKIKNSKIEVPRGFESFVSMFECLILPIVPWRSNIDGQI